MSESTIRFDDGQAYEQYMGIWSRIAGEQFLDWLKPAPSQAWADIGCGNGAFTQVVVDRCRPEAIRGFDPSPQQIAYARARFPAGLTDFQQADAMALPLADACIDHAVMALVIFFVADPARAVGEMARVLRPGGSASAYAWDVLAGGFPWAAVQEAMRTIGLKPAMPPSPSASELSEMERLWRAAGFEDVQNQILRVERPFPDFDTYFQIALSGPSARAGLVGLGEDEIRALKSATLGHLGGPTGSFTVQARAHAVKGRRPI
jgi:ubiquinone/menaquinone biosynthesis C-methylase UbiE